MTRLVEVRRIPIRTSDDYVDAREEVLDADRRGDVVVAEPDAIVIRTRVFIRDNRSAA